MKQGFERSKQSWLIPFISLLFIIFPMLTPDETGSMGVMVWMSILVFSIIGYHFPKVIRADMVASILLWIDVLLITFVSSLSVINHDIIKYLAFVIIYIQLSSYNYSFEQIKKGVRIYVFLSLVLSVLIILSYLGGYPHVNSMFEGNIRYSIGITGLYKNPNYIVAFTNVAAFVLMYEILFSKKAIRIKLIYILFVLIIFAGVFLSGTRAALLTFVGMIVLLAMGSGFKKRSIVLVVFLVVFFIFVIISIPVITDFIDIYGSTRGGFSEDDVRTMAWSMAFSNILGSPLFGCGLNSWITINSGTIALHNIFLELILNQGVLGFLLLLVLMFSGIRETKKNDKLFIYVFIFVNAFPLVFQNGLVDVTFWRVILMIRIAIEYSRNNSNGLSEVFEVKKDSYRKSYIWKLKS